ncbi:muraminidase [Aliarcobacter skirrowii]|uniref:lysozyme n=1 Tax=Aliarcobacter skirrowii TaxID=28200 RepID=UPI00100A6EE0|nr:lysozyme [Aliarcobacter skirrowii]RXJ79808.1 muraminidase [Aliarcobacter skirrowii]
MKVSSKGIELIKEFEGFSSSAYLCSAGKWTIGYGNTFWEDKTPVKKGDEISKTKATELITKIANEFARDVATLIQIDVTQNQFDALVSLAYNIGLGAFKSSTLLNQLNKGNFIGAGQEFLRWNKSNGKPLLGLTRRREREKLLFESL